jgi:methylthioribose-1-phosphate isomerase
LVQEELREAAEQARDSAEEARKAAVELRQSMEEALKAASDQLSIMQEVQESIARAKGLVWDPSLAGKEPRTREL